MSRKGAPVGLIIAVVAVTASALLLWMIMQSGDDDTAAVAPAPVPSSVSSRPLPREARPELPQVATADEPRGARPDREPATETIINGVRVRDHRKDRSKPIHIPDRPRPESGRRIPPSLTRDISDRLLPLVRECATGVPPEARGPKPRVLGNVVIAIKNKQVQVSQATFALTDVFGAPAEPTQQCIQQKALGITLPAPDEEDLENYPVQVSLSLP
jgi:hypothetical protein